MANVDLDIKVDFFIETHLEVQEVLKKDKVLNNTLNDIIEFMSYMGIEKITLSGKTPEDDKKYRDNLKNRKVLLNN